MDGGNGEGEQPAGINEGEQRGAHGTERPASHHRILHFTDKGKKSMTAFFGEDYLDNLGEAFDTTIDNYISF